MYEFRLTKFFPDLLKTKISPDEGIGMGRVVSYPKSSAVEAGLYPEWCASP